MDNIKKSDTDTPSEENNEETTKRKQASSAKTQQQSSSADSSSIETKSNEFSNEYSLFRPSKKAKKASEELHGEEPSGEDERQSKMSLGRGKKNDDGNFSSSDALEEEDNDEVDIDLDGKRAEELSMPASELLKDDRVDHEAEVADGRTRSINRETITSGALPETSIVHRTRSSQNSPRVPSQHQSHPVITSDTLAQHMLQPQQSIFLLPATTQNLEQQPLSPAGLTTHHHQNIIGFAPQLSTATAAGPRLDLISRPATSTIGAAPVAAIASGNLFQLQNNPLQQQQQQQILLLPQQISQGQLQQPQQVMVPVEIPPIQSVAAFAPIPAGQYSVPLVQSTGTQMPYVLVPPTNRTVQASPVSANTFVTLPASVPISLPAATATAAATSSSSGNRPGLFNQRHQMFAPTSINRPTIDRSSIAADSLPPSRVMHSQGGLSVIATASSNNNPSSGSIRLLSLQCDQDGLSPFQCLLRKQIELFEANDEDGKSGRNKAIITGKVGIRCKHCSPIPPNQRLIGSTYYPTTLFGIYQSAQKMASLHICGNCTNIPESIKHRLCSLKNRKSSFGCGKQYWADTAGMLGVYEDPEKGCLFFKRRSQSHS